VDEAWRRWPARLLVPVLVLAGGCIATGRLVPPPLVLWAAFAGFCYVTAGTAVGTPGGALLVFLGMVGGTMAAMLVSGAAVAVGLVASGVLFARPVLARRPLAVSLVAAGLGALPLMYGALAAGRPGEGILPWTLAAWALLVRGLIEDVERGPRSRLGATAAVLALGFVPASLVWPARAGYGSAYFLVAMFADLALLAVATRLLVGRVERLTVLVNGAMALGLIALVAGKVT
jgi:hypothetical protein